MPVRRVVPQDWPELWPLLVGMGVRDSETVVKKRFERLTAVDSWFITVHDPADGPLLGYAGAQDYGDHLRAGRLGRVARLHDLFVEPAARRRGVGRELVASVVDWASTRVAHLQWQAHEGDAAAFYEHLGYRGEPCPQPDYPEFEVSFP
jgi:GNAT superfamily N-acetyltransferase